jgi:hypothetical protein
MGRGIGSETSLLSPHLPVSHLDPRKYDKASLVEKRPLLSGSPEVKSIRMGLPIRSAKKLTVPTWGGLQRDGNVSILKSLTRNCGFCAVEHSAPSPLDEAEPGEACAGDKTDGSSLCRDYLGDP